LVGYTLQCFRFRRQKHKWSLQQGFAPASCPV
jgi:hypothetical protein